MLPWKLLPALLVLGLGTTTLVAQETPRGPDAYPLSLPLQTLERDLKSDDYREVLGTMIPTDLAAEWQRVATADNYHRFAQEHGGLERVLQDERLQQAFERRKRIADDFLQLLSEAYAKKKIKPPFQDPAVLVKALASVDRRGAAAAQSPAVEPLVSVPDAAKHWPGLRGFTGQGIVADTRIPARWSDSESIIWKAPLPGRGNSSPIVWGEKLFVTAEGSASPADGGEGKGPERLLLCFDRGTGSLQWSLRAPPPKELETLYWKNCFASSTPVTDGERVIAFFGNSGLICSDLNGNRQWHRDLGGFPTMHGPGSSPVLYDDLVIFIQDQTQGKSLAAAFDKRTGETRWQIERANNPCWSTPVLLRIGDRHELVFNGSQEVVSYDPGTGTELWKVQGTSIESIPMVVSGGGLIFSTSGRNGPTMAIRPGGRGDITETHVQWRNERGGPHVPSPAYHDDRLYLLGDTGILTCLNAQTGDTLWQQRLRGKFSMSPLLLNDRLLLVNEEGVSYLIQSGPRFKLLAENRLSETTVAIPAILEGRIYFRSHEHLICVGEQP